MRLPFFLFCHDNVKKQMKDTSEQKNFPGLSVETKTRRLSVTKPLENGLREIRDVSSDRHLSLEGGTTTRHLRPSASIPVFIPCPYPCPCPNHFRTRSPA
jgi:hypothetical protein